MYYYVYGLSDRICITLTLATPIAARCGAGQYGADRYMYVYIYALRSLRSARVRTRGPFRFSLIT